MKSIINVSVFVILCLTVVAFMVSCGNPANTQSATDKPQRDSDAVTEKSKVQQVADCLHDNAVLTDGRIHLFFGSRVTLTVENFNKLLLEDKLGLSSDDYTFVIDNNILDALKHNDAYGGIGFGQEWMTSITASLKDVITGEISSPIELMVTLHKSSDAEEMLTVCESASTAEAVSASN